jgi:hypothetical protein
MKEQFPALLCKYLRYFAYLCAKHPQKELVVQSEKEFPATVHIHPAVKYMQKQKKHATGLPQKRATGMSRQGFPPGFR